MAAAVLLLILPLLFTSTVNAKPTKCPAFSEWKPWSECLWFPVQEMYENMTKACDAKPTLSMEGLTKPLKGYAMPDRCGHCSFKTRCHTRPKTKGCVTHEYENEVCHDYSDICTMPKIPYIKCMHNLWREKLLQCANSPDITEHDRTGFKKMVRKMPQYHCIEKDDQCKCCCGEYEPNEAGTECIRPPAVDCPAFQERSNWSECLWFPLKEMQEKTIETCQLESKPDDYKMEAKAPEGLQIPEKCGYCSFKVACQKRERKEGCFPVNIEKRSCGPEDCPTCGDVCTIDKVNGSCHWTRGVHLGIVNDFRTMSKEKSLAHWKRDGWMDVITMLPYAECKEVDDKCKCCCHPYQPSEDGSSCVIRPYCKVPSEDESESQSSESKEKPSADQASSESHEHHHKHHHQNGAHHEHHHKEHHHDRHHDDHHHHKDHHHDHRHEDHHD